MDNNSIIVIDHTLFVIIRNFLAPSAPIVHILLIITAIASKYCKPLKNLASHGKTRVQKVEHQQYEPTNNDNIQNDCLLKTQRKQQHSESSDSKRNSHTGFNDFGHLLELCINDDILQVPKRRFIDFYIIGFVWTTFVIFLLFSHDHHHDHHQYHSMTDSSNILHQNRISILLLYVHLGRRIYECRYIHIWNGTMHIAGWLLGTLHYVLLPLLFIPTWKDIHRSAALKDQKEVMLLVDNEKSCNFHQLLILSIAAFNIYFQYEQHIHHVILAKSRQRIKKHHFSKNSAKQTNTLSKQYNIQFGRWFQYISCPHYTAEIMIYMSFATIVSLTKNNTHGNEDITQTLWPMVQYYREWILLLWVFVNLAVSATTSHSWYKSHFGEKYPKNRKALIPYIW